jgi:hypothetical protein
MRLLGVALLLGLFVALPAVSADEPTKARDNKDQVDGDGLAPGFFTGTLKSVPTEKDRAFLLHVEYGRLEVKDAAGLSRANARLSALAGQINQLQTNIARSPNPDALLGRLQDLTAQLQREAGARQNLFRVIPERKDIQFHAAPDLLVRVKRPPGEFDEKGDIRKFTPEELKTLKGKHPDLPGYEARESDLAPGQFVRVTHGNPAPLPPGSTGAGRATNVRATLILILADSAPDPNASKSKKKK